MSSPRSPGSPAGVGQQRRPAADPGVRVDTEHVDLADDVGPTGRRPAADAPWSSGSPSSSSPRRSTARKNPAGSNQSWAISPAARPDPAGPARGARRRPGRSPEERLLVRPGHEGPDPDAGGQAVAGAGDRLRRQGSGASAATPGPGPVQPSGDARAAGRSPYAQTAPCRSSAAAHQRRSQPCAAMRGVHDHLGRISASASDPATRADPAAVRRQRRQDGPRGPAPQRRVQHVPGQAAATPSTAGRDGRPARLALTAGATVPARPPTPASAPRRSASLAHAGVPADSSRSGRSGTAEPSCSRHCGRCRSAPRARGRAWRAAAGRARRRCGCRRRSRSPRPR